MNDNILDMFGLDRRQLEVMYSIEKILTERDIRKNPKSSIVRTAWKDLWLKTLDDSLYSETNMKVYAETDIIEGIKSVASESQSNTWFYLVMLEATTFQAYFPLKEEEGHIKELSKLKYTRDTDYLKQIAFSSGIMNPEYIDRYIETYEKMYRKLSGKVTKAVITGVSILAVTAITAASGAIFAGPIAVSLFGSQFALSGAALTSACLAMAGGGAIAIGGGGIAAGVAAIAGGGALLGAAGGSAAAATLSAFIKKSSDFTLSQAVKLEVVLREVLLNAQKDTISAQRVIERLQNQVKDLKYELNCLKDEQDKDKEVIDNLKNSIEILKKTINDMILFKSSFEIGMDNDN